MDVASERIEAALDIAETMGLAEVLSQALNTKALILPLETVARRAVPSCATPWRLPWSTTSRQRLSARTTI